ncbi:MAG: hypothetical protein LUC40_06165, partial [Oscillospiraceae bacterium]|nr:hypothetical protein [Oscillospiraceae bacterium]
NPEELYDRSYVSDELFFYFQQVKLATAITDAVLIAEERYFSPRFSDKMRELPRTEFAAAHGIALLERMIYGKIRNEERHVFSMEERGELWELYCRAVEHVLARRAFAYRRYRLEEFMRHIYARVRRRPFRDWMPHDVRLLDEPATEALVRLQRRMRRMYE